MVWWMEKQIGEVMPVFACRLGYSIKKHMTEEVLYKDRDSQIKAIKETFEFAKAPVRCIIVLSIH